MADAVQTVAPGWGDDNFKKRFIIYNRKESDTHIQNNPDIKNMSTGDRSAIVFDTVNRNAVLHVKGDEKTKDTVLLGHTYVEGTGKHNEIFNDYEGNVPSDYICYSMICGYCNTSEYITATAPGGSFACGHYNKADSSYIFTIGNGANKNKRSNIIAVTTNSITIYGDDSNNDTVSIGHGKIYIDGDAYIGTGASQVSLNDFIKKLNTVYNMLYDKTILIN